MLVKYYTLINCSSVLNICQGNTLRDSSISNSVRLFHKKTLGNDMNLWYVARAMACSKIGNDECLLMLVTRSLVTGIHICDLVPIYTRLSLSSHVFTDCVDFCMLHHICTTSNNNNNRKITYVYSPIKRCRSVCKSCGMHWRPKRCPHFWSPWISPRRSSFFLCARLARNVEFHQFFFHSRRLNPRLYKAQDDRLPLFLLKGNDFF